MESKYQQQCPVIVLRTSPRDGRNWQLRVNSVYVEAPETEATSSPWGSRRQEVSAVRT